MEYKSVKEIAEEWGLSTRSVRRMASDGRIKGSVYLGGTWLIPADTTRPADGRTRKASEGAGENASEGVPEAASDIFKFPFFLVKSAYKELDPDNSDEIAIYNAQKALNRCEFEEGFAFLNGLDAESMPYYLKAGYFYTLCLLYRNSGNLRNARIARLNFQFLLSGASEHKPDLLPLLQDLDSLFTDAPSDANISITLEIDHNYHPAALAYARCTSIYHSYAAVIDNAPESIFTIFESICKEYEYTEDDILALSAHTYLAFLYHMRGDKDRFCHHCEGIISVYERTGYYLLTSAFVTVFGPDFERLLDEKCPELKEKLEARASHLHEMALQSDSYNQLAFKLSKKELQICLLVVAGKSNGEIASELNFSTSLINSTLSDIYDKMNIKNRKELKALMLTSLTFTTNSIVGD